MPLPPSRQPELPLGPAADELPVPTEGDVRSLLVGDRVVHYALRRGRRRSIGLTIDGAGLRVGAPSRAPIREIETAIRRHGDWVLDKLRVWAEREPSPPLAIADGTLLPVLGREVVVQLATGNNRIAWHGDVLVLALRAGTAPAALLERALRARALAFFAERLAHYAGLLGVAPPPLALSSARRRWGSCSRVSGIRLNWRLVFCAPHLIDYVVAHELAHLREMNHSPRFWQVVAAIYPDWQAARRQLRAVSEQLPRLA